MPCQYCKLPGHTLTQCNADINVYLGQITGMIDNMPFAMRHQFQALNTYKKPLLSLICVRLGYCASVTSLRKTLLIDNIIEHYFAPRLQLAANLGEVYANARLQIFEAFRDLQMWNIDNKPDLCFFRNSALQSLDQYHTVAFGISYTDSLRAVQQLPVSIRFMALLNFPPQAFVQLLQREEQSNAHLKKLDFHIKTDSSLGQAKECFICSEERPHAKLGCAHEYCIDCLFGTAKVRTKSFISCAVCRAEIEEVQVGTDETKTGLLQRLSEV